MLCKCDLVTGMVGEFPDLQGTMGRYYAIADGEPDNVADAIADRPGVGTIVRPQPKPLSARKLWIGFAAEVAGAVRVDDGARRALIERPVSLLPAGVTEITSGFAVGDVIDVLDADGVAVARGRASVGARDLVTVIGSQTRDLPDGMVHEVIHRDDLVVLSTPSGSAARGVPSDRSLPEGNSGPPRLASD